MLFKEGHQHLYRGMCVSRVVLAGLVSKVTNFERSSRAVHYYYATTTTTDAREIVHLHGTTRCEPRVAPAEESTSRARWARGG